MAADQPSGERQRPATKFSLGTLFLVVTSAGVASVAFRVANDGSFGQRLALATVFVGAFLTLWFVVTLQFKRLRYAGVLLIVGLPSVFLHAVSIDEGSHYHPTSQGNLRQIGLALLNYHQAYGSFPPAYVADAQGKQLDSWRVLILPYLEEGNLYKSIRKDEAWDSPRNAKLTGSHLEAFSCPENRDSTKSPPTTTDFLAVVGPHTAWAGAKPRKLSDFKNPSKTILVVQVVNSGIDWAEPRDLYVGQMPLAINPTAGQGISSSRPGGALVLFADAHVEFLENSTDPKKLAEMLDIDGLAPSNSAAEGASR